MSFWKICLFMLVLGLPLEGNARLADVTCEDSLRLSHTLSKVMGAERQGTGLRYPETLVEIWITPSNGDWLIVQNYTNGTSCIVAMGEYWEATPQEPA